MRTIFFKYSGNRRKQYAITTRICLDGDKKIIIKEACFPEGMAHIRNILSNKSKLTKKYNNVEINNSWLENDKFIAEYIEGISLSELYDQAALENDKQKFLELLKYHITLAMGQVPIKNFKRTGKFTKIFGSVLDFENEDALDFSFFDLIPDNIIFRNGDMEKPCFIDYEWCFDFPVPVSLIKFRIAIMVYQQVKPDAFISFEEILRSINCRMLLKEGVVLLQNFTYYVFKENAIDFLNVDVNFRKKIFQSSEVEQNQENKISTLFFDRGNGFSESEKQLFSFSGNEINIFCIIPEDTKLIKFDPIELCGCVVSHLEILSNNGLVDYEMIDGYDDGKDNLIFINTDPAIKIYGARYWIKLRCHIIILSDFEQFHIFNGYINHFKEYNNILSEQENLVTERDSLLAEKDNLIKIYPELTTRNITLYFNTGKGYNENEMQRYSFTGNEVDLFCTIPENIIAVRMDPIEGYGCIVSNLEMLSYDGVVKYKQINGYKNDNGDIVFANSDPQIELQRVANWISIKYRILLLSNFSHYSVINNYITTSQQRDNLVAERDSLVEERDGLVVERNGLVAERNGLVTERDYLVTERDGLVVERNGLIAERDSLVIERSNLVTERDGLIAERNGLVVERNGLVTERDSLVAERDRLVTERDGLSVERDHLLGSRSWRFTKPLRGLAAFVRRHKVLRLFAKGILSIKRNGIKKTIKKVVTYKRTHIQEPLSSLTPNTYCYQSEYQKNIDFSIYEPKIKSIAFYLPQFHAIPENDKWWGKDFTEWTNTSKAKPRFIGHYQPREPHKDIGYYNLTNIEALKKQAKLAKQHGIYGFCFYLYWFSGKRLLEKPIDLLLTHPEIDINFCLCWANENWTRRWDGKDQEILIKQNYSDDDPYKFIEDMQKYINDKRYIRIDGIPVILVYYPGHIPNVRDVFIKWKKHADEIGIGKIKIWICNTWGHTVRTLNIEDIIDGVVEFPPHNMQHKGIYYEKDIATIADYEDLVSEMEKSLNMGNIIVENGIIPFYRTCLLGWDNTPRKEIDWFIYGNFSLKYFHKWVSLLVNEALHDKKEFIFINAWNEWAEGTYLEPDKKYGYANINTLSKAICGLPFMYSDSKGNIK